MPEQETMKLCSRCGGEVGPQPLSAFGKRKSSPDGHKNTCKECERKYWADYRERNRSQINRRKRENYQENAEDRRSYQRQWYKDHAGSESERRREARKPCVRLWHYQDAPPKFRELSPFGDGRDVWVAVLPKRLAPWYFQWLNMSGLIELSKYEVRIVDLPEGGTAIFGAAYQAAAPAPGYRHQTTFGFDEAGNLCAMKVEGVDGEGNPTGTWVLRESEAGE